MFVLCWKCLDNIPKQSPEYLVPIRLFLHPLQPLRWILEENSAKFAQVSTPAWGSTWLPTFAVPQKGWSNTSFITPESCIALVYSEPYGKSIWKRDGIENHGILNAKNTLGLMGSQPKVARNFGLGPFLKLIFRMVPNKLAQYNFQALWTRYLTTLFGVQRKLVNTW